MLTRVLAATVAGGIVFFLLGFIIYGVVLQDAVMKPNMNSFPGLLYEVPVWIPLILANLVSAFTLAIIFDRWAGIRTFAGGMQLGAVIYFLFSLANQLLAVSMMNLTKNYAPQIADVIGSSIMGAVAGGVIGLILGKMTKGEDRVTTPV
jgi:hypothetical protein